MSNVAKTRSFGAAVRLVVTSTVFGLFLAACGSEPFIAAGVLDALNNGGASTVNKCEDPGELFCGSGYPCCPPGYPYQCVGSGKCATKPESCPSDTNYYVKC